MKNFSNPKLMFLQIDFFLSFFKTEINASKRLKEAAAHKAEADKIKQVKAAEAEAEAR